ncbi:TetR/AcrR family transcriptional regulator [Bradyrhizobium sp. 2TAF24]|uniref:TetR/AcrR family transcriptional regulator n=1 Tax=Bradyrhizobium sp. 2TAF24 TaxID=3233011 RepID=UPI003F8F736E
MTGRRRWTTEDILDATEQSLRTDGAEAFSVRKVAAALGTDPSSLYRHFRDKTELLRALTDRVLKTAMDDYRGEGDWKQRIVGLALRLRETFGERPELAAIWGRYASGGAGSRQVVEDILQALQMSGLPDEQIPLHYHRIVLLIAALIVSDAGIGTIAADEYERGLELFRVTVLGADPERFPALARFSRDLLPLGAERRAAFEAILRAQLAEIETKIPRKAG